MLVEETKRSSVNIDCLSNNLSVSTLNHLRKGHYYFYFTKYLIKIENFVSLYMKYCDIRYCSMGIECKHLDYMNNTIVITGNSL